MSRRKRAPVEHRHEDNNDNDVDDRLRGRRHQQRQQHQPPSSSDEEAPGEQHDDRDEWQTPSKRVRLNLATEDEGFVEEETKATGAVATTNKIRNMVTPGVRKREAKEKTAPESSSLADSPMGTAAKTSQTDDDGNDDGSGTDAVDPVSTVDSKARRNLFSPPSQPRATLVTPSKGSPAPMASPARRRLYFGRYATETVVSPSVRKVYAIIRKLTGQLGGNASPGPIYGELTMGSMQKMVNLMKEHTDFNESSRFIDVGSGIGKPSLHCAQDPGVEFSYGIEVDDNRWHLGLTCLRGVLKEISVHESSPSKGGNGEGGVLRHHCFFDHGDIQQAHTFHPFTHVYMFSIGFPPRLWENLADIWNRSTSPYLICYHSPRDIIDAYEFNVELLAQIPTSMHGSKEGHTGYIYRRTLPSTIESANGENVAAPVASVDDCDPLFRPAWEMVQQGFPGLRKAVNRMYDERTKGTSTTTRSRRHFNSS